MKGILQGNRAGVSRGLSCRLLAVAVLVQGLAFSLDALGQQINSLPYTLTFDTNAYASNMLHVSTNIGATHTYEASGGWRGGAAKFTPPTDNEGYSGLGQFHGLNTLGAPLTQLNVRFLVYHGASLPTRAPHVKLLITNRENNFGEAQRPMIISAGSSRGRLYLPCHNIACDLTTREQQAFYVDDHLEEWVSMELEVKLVEEEINLYIYTADGRVAGLVATNNFMDPNDHRPLTDNPFSYIDGLGYYWGPPNEVSSLGFDENTYIKFDELVIDDSYIGPPAGFVAPAPAAPTNVTAR